MESLDVLSSGELLPSDPSENIDESFSESEVVLEFEVFSDSDAESQDVASTVEESLPEESSSSGSVSPSIDLEPVTLVLSDCYDELVAVHEALDAVNSVLLCMIFFMVAQWVLSKVKGAVERMLQWKI